MKGKNQQKVVKKYKDIQTSDFVRFGNSFVDEFFLDKESVEIPIDALRIIFNIVSILRNEQFQKDNQPKQLSLFEEEFETEHNSYAQMKIKNSLISLTKNTKRVKQAYEFLTKFKMGWYKSENSKGKIIETYGGLILAPSYDERGYTSFLISSYWLKKLLLIPEYNYTLYSLVYNIKNNKHLLFYFWLCKIPEQGTKVGYISLNDLFNVNYKNTKDFCNKFLKPIRENLNKFSTKSFNYSIRGNNINIKPYLIKTLDNEEMLKESTLKKIKNNYTSRYIKERHSLTDEEIKGISQIIKSGTSDSVIFSEAYKEFIKWCRKNDTKATNFRSKEFILKLQEFIKIEYSKTTAGKNYPNGYPRI